MINIAERIKDLMEQKGWSCYELSIQSGISSNTIYEWYRIGTKPTLSNVVKVCSAMNISLEQFFSKDGTYRLSKEEKTFLCQWSALNEEEKYAILNVIKVFKILKKK